MLFSNPAPQPAQHGHWVKISQNTNLMLSCRSWEAPKVGTEAPSHEIYPSWQFLQQHLPAQWSCSV